MQYVDVKHRQLPKARSGGLGTGKLEDQSQGAFADLESCATRKSVDSLRGGSAQGGMIARDEMMAHARHSLLE